MAKRIATLAVAVLITTSLLALVDRPGVADEGAKTPVYVGADSCKKCHFTQHKSWTKTPLALAFEQLKPDQAVEAKKKAGLDPKKDYTGEAKCLKCHTTAYGQASGYPAVTKDEAFTEDEKARAVLNQGVTCEACHGPGSLYGPYKKEHKDYKRAEIVKLGALAPVTEASCAPCHKKECPTMPKDYVFKFEDFKTSDKLHKRKKLKHEH